MLAFKKNCHITSDFRCWIVHPLEQINGGKSSLLSLSLSLAKKRQIRRQDILSWIRAAGTFKLASPLLLPQLWASGGGDPLRPLRGLQAKEAGGSINGDEKCPHSFLMSLCFKEENYVKAGEGESAEHRGERGHFPGLQAPSPQCDMLCTKMHLPLLCLPLRDLRWTLSV